MEDHRTSHPPRPPEPSRPATPTGALGHWLAAEAVDDPRAEEHLAALFTALPLLDPPPGFAARVGERVAAGRISRALPAPLRWLTAAVLLLGAFGWALSAELVRSGLEALPNPLVLLSDLASLATRGFVFVASLLTQVPEWFRLARLAAATPPVVLFGCLTVLAAAVLLRLLQQTVDRERTWSHA